MSLSVESRRVVYNGNGSTTAFSIPFSFQNNTGYVGVQLYTDDDTIVDWAYTTDYTISGSTLTAVTAPATGKKLVIYSKVPLSQGDDYQDTVPFLPSSMETSLDKLAQQIQQLDEAVKRAPKFNRATSLSNIEMPATITAEAVLVANADGDGLEWGPSVSEIEGWADTAESSAAAASSSATSAASSASSASSSATSAAASASSAATSASSAAASAASLHGVPSGGSAGQALLKNSGTDYDAVWGAAGVTDHGALTGLSDDDHSNYALLAGRSGGQTLTGGSDASDQLVLRSTSNGTVGAVKIADQTGETTRVGPTGSASTFNNTHEFLITGGSSSGTDGLVVRRNDRAAFHASSGDTNAAGIALLPRGPSGSPEIRMVSTGGDQDCYIRLYDTGFGNLYGYLGIGSTFKMMNANASIVPFWVSGTTGQSVPLQKWSNQNDGANFVSQVAKDGHFQGPNGSASVPTFGFMNDTNTGIYGDGSDALKIATGGSDRVTVSSAGALRLHNYGIGTLVSDASGNITASSSGSVLDIKSKSANYTLTDAEDVIICTGTWTLTLHSAATATKKAYRIKNVGTGIITIARAGSDTIDGDTSFVLMPSAAPYPAVELIPNGGTAWYVF